MMATVMAHHLWQNQQQQVMMMVHGHHPLGSVMMPPLPASSCPDTSNCYLSKGFGN
jgi:hypothetical protein